MEQSIEQFTSSLSSKQAIPGGGGASALTGALAASLGSMVGNLTIHKKKYKDVEETILKCMKKTEALRLSLLNRIQEDAQAFEPLSRAYGIPKENPQRNDILESCLKQAAMPPFHMVKDICEVIEQLEIYGQYGSKLAISDAATGAAFAYGALKGAAINVFVNTKLMKDKEYAFLLEKKVNAYIDEYAPRALKIYDSVLERL
ncbi:cyclodeaminase/cyclohydrolase family protein [Floccifex sp.]|uniref:cyclodeaminase/cyclohydrolase family protein n=1 Tax=Floccifex sp. TaxID=2815810 RepID=UPI003F0A19FE